MKFNLIFHHRLSLALGWQDIREIRTLWSLQRKERINKYSISSAILYCDSPAIKMRIKLSPQQLLFVLRIRLLCILLSQHPPSHYEHNHDKSNSTEQCKVFEAVPPAFYRLGCIVSDQDQETSPDHFTAEDRRKPFSPRSLHQPGCDQGRNNEANC